MIAFNRLKRNLKSDLTGLPCFKIAVVGDTATQLLCTAIRGMGVERGYNIDLFEAEYNQVERQLLDPTSDLYRFNGDFMVIFQSTHKLGEHQCLSFVIDLAIRSSTILKNSRLRAGPSSLIAMIAV